MRATLCTPPDAYNKYYVPHKPCSSPLTCTKSVTIEKEREIKSLFLIYSRLHPKSVILLLLVTVIKNIIVAGTDPEQNDRKGGCRDSTRTACGDEGVCRDSS